MNLGGRGTPVAGAGALTERIIVLSLEPDYHVQQQRHGQYVPPTYRPPSVCLSVCPACLE